MGMGEVKQIIYPLDIIMNICIKFESKGFGFDLPLERVFNAGRFRNLKCRRQKTEYKGMDPP
jgi:hypothetical protein